MARSLVQSKITKEIRTANGGASEDDGLPPGHMRLYSYYKPALRMFSRPNWQSVSLTAQQRPGSMALRPDRTSRRLAGAIRRTRRSR